MSFLDGNSATFLGAIMTLAVLCFFGTDIEEGKVKKTNSTKLKEKNNGSNFIQKLLSIIVVRALEFLKREEATHVETLKIDNYETLSNAIAKSEEKTNPYKQEMLSLANNLQFLTVKYQTDIMTLRLDIEYFMRK